jgi:hypothetical protein
MYSPLRFDKAFEDIVWVLRDQGTPSEKDLDSCRKVGEALAKAVLEKEAKVPTK